MEIILRPYLPVDRRRSCLSLPNRSRANNESVVTAMGDEGQYTDLTTFRRLAERSKMSTARSKRVTSDRKTVNGTQKVLSFGGSRITKPNASALLHSKVASNPKVALQQQSASSDRQASQTSRTPRQIEATRKLTAEEYLASRVTDADLKRFSVRRDNERLAPAAHQDNLGIEVKVLRFFDTSSQYGPCIGISRSKRWVRAQHLGLSPPIEVLAILLRASNKQDYKVERAYVDELMNY